MGITIYDFNICFLDNNLVVDFMIS
jgi:hypothetical protein